MQWKDEGGRYTHAQIGHLFAYVEHVEPYSRPGEPDYEPASFEWFVAPDDEDKNYRRALASGKANTFQEAEIAIRLRIKALAEKLVADAGVS